MRNNHSARLTTALANLSSDEIILDQNRAARRRGGWRFGPLRFWLAALLVVAGPVLAASQPRLATGIEAGRQRRGRTRRARLVRRAVRRRQHRHRGRDRRQRDCRGGVGLHPQRRCLDPARQQAGRHRRGWTCRTGRLRRAVRRRQHRHRGRTLATTRATGQRGSTPAAAVSGPSRAASWSAPARLDMPGKVAPSRCPPTATPPSWAGPATTRAPGRRGSTPAAAVSGPNRAASWSAPARLDMPDKAAPSRCPPTATPPSWAGLDDNAGTGAAWVYTRSGGVWTQQGSKLVGTGAVGSRQTRRLRRAVRRRQHRHRGRASRQPGTGAAWVYTRSGGVWTQQGSKLVGTGAVGHAGQGFSVALSADGNTAIVGGAGDNVGHRGGVGLHPQRRCLDPTGQQAGRHRRGWKCQTRRLRRAVRRRQHRHRGRACRQRGHRCSVGSHSQRRYLDQNAHSGTRILNTGYNRSAPSGRRGFCRNSFAGLVSPSGHLQRQIKSLTDLPALHRRRGDRAFINRSSWTLPVLRCTEVSQQSAALGFAPKATGVVGNAVHRFEYQIQRPSPLCQLGPIIPWP